MPLLHILGIDNLSQYFTVGYCFLESESKQNYETAISHLFSLYQPEKFPSVIGTDCEMALINAIDRHFPEPRTRRIICFWHICKNLMVNCKARFGKGGRWEDFERFFSDIVYSKTPDEYLDRVEEFKAEFGYNSGELPLVPESASVEELEIYATNCLEQEAIKYALGQWLEPHHQSIVHAWTNQFFSQNTTTTSRLEGAHAVLKRWIGSPSKSLTAVWTSIKLALSDQIDENEIRRARVSSSSPVGIPEFYYGVLGRISHSALYEIRKQLNYAHKEEQRTRDGVSSICTGTFNKAMGIPCWHIIRDMISENRGIQLYGPLTVTRLIEQFVYV